MLLKNQNICFMLIDLQSKLTPLVLEYEHVITHCEWLLSLANALNHPIVVCEQYPKGLGHTVEALEPQLSDAVRFEKTHFSAAKDFTISQYLHDAGYQRLVLCGIEAHVCVLQSAIDFKTMGFEVFVVEEAISSRHALDKVTAIRRMVQSGIELVTREMIFFELIEQAGNETFKRLSKTFL
jgi:nicotinamidase-related amidase